MEFTNKTVKKLDNGFMACSSVLAKISGVIMIGMMTVLFVDVVLSKLFNGGVPRSIELITYWHVPVVYLSLALVQMTESHATVDLLYDKLPNLIRRCLDILWYILGIGICAFETYTSLRFTVEKFTLNTLSNTKNGFPIWPFAAAMCLGWFLMGLSYIWCIIRSFFHAETVPTDQVSDSNLN